MSITTDEIKTLARLARLEFSDERCEQFAGEFDEIINFANGINEQVEGSSESIRGIGGETVAYENLREDEVKDSLPNEKILSNVEGSNGCFTVRRVVK